MQRLTVRLAAFFLGCVLMLCCAVPVSATQSDQAELTIELSALDSSVFAGEELVLEVSVRNSSTQYGKISDLSFIINYDSANLDYSSFVDKPAGVKASAVAGAVEITFTAGSEAECLGAATTWQLKFNAKSSFNAQVARFSTERISACMRRSLSSVSTATSNVAHAFVAAKPLASVSVVLASVSNNAQLACITPVVDGNVVELVPAFSPQVTSYTVTVNYSAQRLELVLAEQDIKASSVINWDKVTQGGNEIEIVVTAADGVTKKIYIVIINRLGEQQSVTNGTTYAAPEGAIAQTTQTIPETDPSETQLTETTGTTTGTTTAQTTTAATTAQTTVPSQIADKPGASRPSVMMLVLGAAAVVVLLVIAFVCGSFIKGSSSKRVLEETQVKLQNIAAQNAVLQQSVAQYNAKLRYIQQQAQQAAYARAAEHTAAESAAQTPASAPAQPVEEGVQYSEEGVGEFVAGQRMIYDEYGNLVEFDRFGNVIEVEYDEYGNRLS